MRKIQRHMLIEKRRFGETVGVPFVTRVVETADIIVFVEIAIMRGGNLQRPLVAL
jgi:hypothetical protein